MDIEALKRTFFLECEELLASAEESLESLNQGADRDSAVNALFRSVHSIKGGAGAFELEHLAAFAHAFESLLSLVRKGEAALTDDLMSLLFDSLDCLTTLVEAARDGGEAPARQIEGTLRLLREASGLTPDGEAPDEIGADFEFVPVRAFDADPEEAPAPQSFTISFRPGPTMLGVGVDPLMVLRALKSLGTAQVATHEVDLPDLADLDPGQCHWSWTIELETAEGRDAIDDILSMVDDLAEIGVEGGAPPPAIIDAPVEPAPILAEQAGPAPPAPSAGAGQRPAPAGAEDEARTLKPQSSAPKTVRVEVPKLERLGNMVGELVITQAFLMRQAGRLSFESHPELFRALEEMSQHIRDLQDSAMALRAQPLKAVFSRFGHLIRDLEKVTGKKVQLSISGDDTEIDKTVVERLSEPLTHLIRNAVDHGIEPVDQRLAAGKPAEGRLRLAAEQRGSQVIIELADDGGGINRARVLAKAIERGLVPADAAPSDEEIDDLIFLPGFSTKDAVTEVSGRGVGMDAVRQAIVDMGGRVAVRSEPGRGSRFLLTLPLSLAVLDAMITVVGSQRFLIPVHNVLRSIRPVPSQILRMDSQSMMLSLHGEVLRIIPVGMEFGVADAVEDPCQGLLVVVDGASDQQRVALMVDDLLGQEPVVVKSLERNYRKVPGVAAATILGDGRAALILDLLTLGQAGGPGGGFAAQRRRAVEARRLLAAAES